MSRVLQVLTKLRKCISSSSRFSSTAAPPAASISPKPKTEVVKDVIMYRYENARFFKMLNIFAVTQFGFWAYLSTSAFGMLSVPVKEKETSASSASPKPTTTTDEEVPFWRNINLGADKYKYGLTIGSFLMGYGILFFSWTYTLRSLRFLILRKDRKSVSFVTYGPFGKNRIMDVPLNCISAAGSRSSGASQIPVKVKGRWFYYILDVKQGEFLQPKLFDQTVGLQRKF